MDKDLYEILGVKKDANEKEIRKAFHNLAKRYHPDVNPGDKQSEQKFKEVNLAYEVLKDSKKRAQYDQMRAMGANPFARGPGGARPGSGGAGPYGPEFYAEFGLGDLFEEIFGGGSPFGGARGRRPGAQFAQRGADREYQMSISFLDAARGAEKSIELPDGRVLSVKIPEGVDQGSRIKLSGQGDKGIGGAPNGDLLIELNIEPHPQFSREGRDVLFRLPISFSEAVLGAEVEVPTIQGKLFLRIPPGVSSGQRLKLAGKGIRDPKTGGVGEQLVELLIKIPKSPDDQYRQAAELVRTSQFNPRS